jgi:hypothetical protein
MAVQRLRREIIAALTLKTAALVLLYVLFFAPAHQPQLDAQSVAAHLAGETPGDIR